VLVGSGCRTVQLGLIVQFWTIGAVRTGDRAMVACRGVWSLSLTGGASQ